jgi:predicted regulator of Ras-like GTPase activity (Roadblock/LC7/MglB family)
MSLQPSLVSLRDVTGVEGSFVVSDSGALLAKDLPAVFSEATLGAAAPRVQRLFEAFETVERPLTHVLLNFGEHRLIAQRFSGGVLCVLARTEARAASLRTAVKLVGRRLAQLSLDAVMAPAVEAKASQAIPADPAATALGKRMMYRGRPVDG